MIETIRMCLGALDLAAAPQVARHELRSRPDRAAINTVRVLGLRQIAQGLLIAGAGTRTAHRIGAAVDGAHCASMLLLALFDRRRRTGALVQASIAAVLGAAELGRA